MKPFVTGLPPYKAGAPWTCSVPNKTHSPLLRSLLLAAKCGVSRGIGVRRRWCGSCPKSPVRDTLVGLIGLIVPSHVGSSSKSVPQPSCLLLETIV
ncbi:uncharacterized protein SPSK_01318 [Sporothrix schenckii 1099-18]|uniref:Uncharacterized protein n=1 Tax=Sporothrix schenckii 1099-18 TaxID=1397361 RepID=A0A0F2LUS1_SPOSC|nr:uncharacterized protein SPSK_01318 [Sporothrix schenckii 1099-18]KJR81218.1 hypothetical protein SPSK_01318 [Sporothrix schenckii 1099-18]